MDEQRFVIIALGPVLSLIIVLAGCIAGFADNWVETRDAMQAEFHAIRAEIEENHSELLEQVVPR
jgi:hypothetical protein